MCRAAGLKNPCLYRHDLLALHTRQQNRFSLNVNKIPEKFVPRKFVMTTKVRNSTRKTTDEGYIVSNQHTSLGSNWSRPCNLAASAFCVFGELCFYKRPFDSMSLAAVARDLMILRVESTHRRKVTRVYRSVTRGEDSL